MSESARELLRKAVAAEKTRKTALEQTDQPELEEARIRLQDYERLVSQLVIQAVQGQPVDIYRDQADPDMDVHLSALAQNLAEPYKPIAHRYRAFKDHLDQLLNLALQAHRAPLPRLQRSPGPTTQPGAASRTGKPTTLSQQVPELNKRL